MKELNNEEKQKTEFKPKYQLTLQDFVDYCKNRNKKDWWEYTNLKYTAYGARMAIIDFYKEERQKGIQQEREVDFNEFLEYCENAPLELVNKYSKLVKKYNNFDDLKQSPEDKKFEEDYKNSINKHEWEKARQIFIKQLFYGIMWFLLVKNDLEQKQKVLELFEDTFWVKKYYHKTAMDEVLNNLEKFCETRNLINIIDCLNIIEDLKDFNAMDELTTLFVFRPKENVDYFENRQAIYLWNIERLKGNLRQLVALCDTTDLYELKNIYDDLKGE